MAKKTTESDHDLQLLAALVARHLRREHESAPPPPAWAYRLEPSGQWVPGRMDVVLPVPVGRETAVRLVGSWHSDEFRDIEDLTGTAEQFAERISGLHASAGTNRSMLSQVRATVRREMAKANRRGLSYRLVDLAPGDIEVDDPSLDFHVRITLEMIGGTPQPEIMGFDACCAEDVTEIFAGLLEGQTSLARTWARMADAGATGAIDALVLADLTEAGVEIPVLLKQLHASPEWAIDIVTPAGEEKVLYWKDGIVEGHVTIGEGSWNQGTVNLRNAPAALAGPVVGRPLAEVLPHHLLDDSIRIRRSHGRPGGTATLWCERRLSTFNAHTGQIW